MSKTRKKYSKEFKRDAVKLLRERGSRAASEGLGIPQTMICRWARKLEEEQQEAFRGNGVRTAEQQRIYELEQELKNVREERDILKKAMGYFADPKA